MSKELQFWGVTIHHRKCRGAHSQCRAIVATTSRAKAARLIGIPENYMKAMASQTGNAVEVAILSSNPPDTVFICEDQYQTPKVNLYITLADLDAR